MYTIIFSSSHLEMTSFVPAEDWDDVKIKAAAMREMVARLYKEKKGIDPDRVGWQPEILNMDGDVPQEGEVAMSHIMTYDKKKQPCRVVVAPGVRMFNGVLKSMNDENGAAFWQIV